MNQPKADTEVPSKALNKYNYEALYNDSLNFYNLHKSIYDTKKSLAEMQSEQITLCEINACLWVKAVHSAVNSITKHTYSHYIIVQKFINYLLTAGSTESFGPIENYFWKLLITHPPGPKMYDYYSHILFENFVCVNGVDVENQSLFLWLLQTVTNCLEVKMNPDGNRNLRQSGSELSVKTRSTFQLSCTEGKESFISNKPSDEVTQKQIEFDCLPVDEKIKRCFIVLNFVYNILETDFSFWLHSDEFKPSTDNIRPLLSNLLWENHQDVGLVNKDIQKLFQLYKLAVNLNFQNICITEKLITLVGEIIRWSDSFGDVKYPFVGTNTFNFCRQLSHILYYRLIEIKNNQEENELIIKFKPPWLQLFLCSQLLTLITKHQCSPELTEICDILEYIVNMKNENTNMEKTPIKSSKPKNPLIKKRKKFENVNARLGNGKTHLHLACENNDVEKIKTLLKFPELDVNAVDQNGWTPLHVAAYEGKTNSVQELLLFSPEPGGAQKSVNTRALGPESTTPLMCAARQGHTKICKLLLEHSGLILLEDVNEFNQTALEITKASAVKRILKNYKSNSNCTENSFKDINFHSDLKKVVIGLCLEMIQAYFSTWGICNRLKQSERTTFDGELYCDYSHYDRDIKTNISKLKSLLPQLESIEEFKSFTHIYITIFSL